MKTFLVYALILIMSVFGLAACERGERGVEAAREQPGAEAGREEPLTPTGRNFAQTAAGANMAEINLARLAKQKATNEQVKEYAQMVETDHQNSLERIQGIMRDLNMTPPSGIDPKHQDTYDRLSKLSGNRFDSEFMRVMVEEHQKAVQDFQQAANTVQNAELKKYAQDMLPKLGQHLNQAQQISNRLGGSKRTNTR